MDVPHYRPDRRDTVGGVQRGDRVPGLHFQPVRGARTSRAAADTRALRAVTPGSGVETLKLDAFRLLQTT